MKNKILSAGILWVALTLGSASAALVATYRPSAAGSGPTFAAFDWHDDVSEPSAFIAHGTVQKVGSSGAGYIGWGQSVDVQNYAGFEMSALPGYNLELTDMRFGYTADTGMTDFVWGYRVDDGEGFGAWNFSQSYPMPKVSPTLGTWTFAQPIVTDGIVEFGIFASGNGSPQAAVALAAFIDVNGSVTQVPEPSAPLLVAVCGLTALLRRRR